MTSLMTQASAATVGALFRRRAEVAPDRVALVDGARRLTYRALDARTDRLANHLTGLGLKPGDRVGLLSQNCAEYLEVMLAAAKGGFIVAALNWRLSDRELAHCIALVEPAVLVLAGDLQARLSGMAVGAVPHLRIGPDFDAAIAAASDRPPDADPAPEDGLVILYTSGTTGLPKGALISHRALVARAMMYAAEFQVPLDDNFCAWPPLYHMASCDQSLATLMRGGTVHVVDGYQPDRLIDFLEAHETALFILMPGIVRDFVDAWTARGARARGVKICGAMADLVPRQCIADASRVLDAPYLNSFGSTETGLPPATSALIPIGEAPVSLSKRQSSFCDVRLVDEDDRDVAAGTPGEIVVRGPTLFSGYWNAAETNAEDFRGGWFHMGDVMRRNPDGTLDYVDRRKYLIKSGGENIYPAEIEMLIAQDARVLETVVVRRRHEKWGEVPVAFVVAAGDGLAPDAVERACAGLSRYKRPRQVVMLAAEALPRSTTGKIQRHVLEERLERGEFD